MTEIALALIFLFLVGFPWGLLLTRSWLFGLVSAPLWTALISTFAAIAAWLTGSSLGIWLVALGLGGLGALVVAIKVRGWPKDFDFHPKLLLPSLLVGAITLLGLRVAPVGWDPRSCWWFRAAWFYRGGPALRRAFENPAFDWVCKDYPPLSSSVVGSSWFVSGGIDFKVAQVTSAVITLSVVLLLILTLRRMFPSTEIASSLIPVPLLLGIYGIAGEGLTNGYNDLLWSAAFTGGALCYLQPEREAPTGLGPPLLAVAALTKNEGMVMAAVLVGLLFVYRMRSEVRLRIITACLALSTGAGWQLVARTKGLESDMADFAFALQLTAVDVLERGRFVLLAMWHSDGWVILAGILLLLFAPKEKRLLGLSVLSAVYLVVLWATYVFLSGAMEFQLEVSLDRALFFPKLTALTIAAYVLLHFAATRSLGLNASPAEKLQTSY